MKVTLTNHAKQRIEERLNVVINADVIDVSNMIYTQKYTNNFGQRRQHFVCSLNKKACVLVVDTVNKMITTVMTEGKDVSKDFAMAKNFLQRRAAKAA